MSFYVGQQVVCVDDSPHACFIGAKMPQKFAVYTIRAIRPARRVVEHQVLLCEIINQSAQTELDGFGEPHFKVSRFRRVKTTDISIFTKMLAPTPREREPA